MARIKPELEPPEELLFPGRLGFRTRAGALA